VGTSEQSERSRVVVVGGGYGGVAVAKALDGFSEVVLIEPRDAFMHNIAALRALVDPFWLPKIFFPYTEVLANGRVVRDRASMVEPHRVVTSLGEEFGADYIVLATGSRYPFPAKTDLINAEKPARKCGRPTTLSHRLNGCCWSEPARSASNWPGRSVPSGLTSRLCCSTWPTRC